MKTKHTKGEWELKTRLEDTSNIANIIGGDGKKIICTLSAYEFRNCSIEETNSNAKLIAAAPELLEALQMIMNNSQVRKCIDGYFQETQAIKAINKATL